jgi:hypothetical protein
VAEPQKGMIAGLTGMEYLKIQIDKDTLLINSKRQILLKTLPPKAIPSVSRFYTTLSPLIPLTSDLNLAEVRNPRKASDAVWEID